MSSFKQGETDVVSRALRDIMKRLPNEKKTKSRLGKLEELLHGEDWKSISDQLPGRSTWDVLRHYNGTRAITTSWLLKLLEIPTTNHTGTKRPREESSDESDGPPSKRQDSKKASPKRRMSDQSTTSSSAGSSPLRNGEPSSSREQTASGTTTPTTDASSMYDLPDAVSREIADKDAKIAELTELKEKLLKDLEKKESESFRSQLWRLQGDHEHLKLNSVPLEQHEAKIDAVNAKAEKNAKNAKDIADHQQTFLQQQLDKSEEKYQTSQKNLRETKEGTQKTIDFLRSEGDRLRKALATEVKKSSTPTQDATYGSNLDSGHRFDQAAVNSACEKYGMSMISKEHSSDPEKRKTFLRNARHVYQHHGFSPPAALQDDTPTSPKPIEPTCEAQYGGDLNSGHRFDQAAVNKACEKYGIAMITNEHHTDSEKRAKFLKNARAVFKHHGNLLPAALEEHTPTATTQ